MRYYYTSGKMTKIKKKKTSQTKQNILTIPSAGEDAEKFSYVAGETAKCSSCFGK